MKELKMRLRCKTHHYLVDQITTQHEQIKKYNCAKCLNPLNINEVYEDKS